MSEKTSVTTREAVLASLLAHACLIIYVLIFPDTFRAGRLLASGSHDPNQPIPLAFLSQPEGSPEPQELTLSDAGKERVSERRAESALPAKNDDPYTVGNTRNRFVAPPLPVQSWPSPEPAGSGSHAAASAAELAAQGEEVPEGDAADSTVEPDSTASRSRLLMPPEGGHGGLGGAKGSSLREALGRMSMGTSGGAPLKFDNPAGGLNGPLGGLSFDTPGFDWGPYARKIYWVIWTNWTQGWPPAAWAGLKGVVTVHFRIWRDGRITDISVVSPSGTMAFDTCATVALEASSPLPALPQEFPKDSEGITARFLYNTDVADR